MTSLYGFLWVLSVGFALASDYVRLVLGRTMFEVICPPGYQLFGKVL